MNNPTGNNMIISLAPMEGITTYIFRNALDKYYGGVDRYYTPFLTASHLKGREKRDVLPANNTVPEIVPQILTNDPELFLKISDQLQELGYTMVNLNLGCPSGTVVSKGRGAGFLSDPKKLDAFFDNIFSNTKLEISVKTRIGVEFLSEWDDILEVFRKYPIKELIIHPRLRQEFYDGTIHLDAFDKAFKVIPITTKLIYNGDIIDYESYSKIADHLANLKADWKNDTDDPRPTTDFEIMIGRGLIANPALAQDIKNKSQGNDIAPFDKSLFNSFLSELISEYSKEMSNDKQVVMKMKELWVYLARGLGIDKSQLKEILKVKNLSEYRNIQQMILSSIHN